MARYGGKDVVIDDSEFQRKAKKLAKQYGVDEKEFIKDQTGLLAREVAKFTPPWASFPKHTGTGVGTAKDIKAGKMAVLYDLYKILSPRKKGVVTWAKKTFQNRPIYIKGKVVAPFAIDDAGELEAWHSQQQMPNGRTRKLAKDQRPWVSQPLFNRHVKQEQAKVGIAKAAFVKASIQLGAKGTIPKAVLDNLNKPSGSGNVGKTAKGPQGIITGRADGLWHTKRFLPELMTNRLKKAVKRLEYIGRESAKKAGFKTT